MKFKEYFEEEVRKVHEYACGIFLLGFVCGVVVQTMSVFSLLIGGVLGWSLSNKRDTFLSFCFIQRYITVLENMYTRYNGGDVSANK